MMTEHLTMRSLQSVGKESSFYCPLYFIYKLKPSNDLIQQKKVIIGCLFSIGTK